MSNDRNSPLTEVIFESKVDATTESLSLSDDEVVERIVNEAKNMLLSIQDLLRLVPVWVGANLRLRFATVNDFEGDPESLFETLSTVNWFFAEAVDFTLELQQYLKTIENDVELNTKLAEGLFHLGRSIATARGMIEGFNMRRAFEADGF